jgi:biotin synthase
VSGPDAIYAETGANPRDLEQDTAHGRGLDVRAAKRMLIDAGFEWLRLGNGSRVRLAA